MKLIASILLLLIPAIASAEGGIRRFAFIAGANDGGGERARLRYATSDAQAVARVLKELGGVTHNDELVLLDPDKAALTRGFDTLRERMRAAHGAHARVELVVYYSGHSDEDGLLLKGGERVPYKEFRGALEALPADVRIAIVDSCASGALTRKKGGTARPPFLLDESAKVSGHAILTSSSEHEAAQESDRIGASFFTHYLLSGLRGAADVTADGRVTLNEAYQFAFAETLARTEKTQSGPQHAAYDIQLAGTGDLVMTDVRATTAGLVLPELLSGRLFVRDENERLVAELWKQEGRAVELGLAPGAYSITMEAKDGVYAMSLTLQDGVRTPLLRERLVRVKRELTAMRGDAPAASVHASEAPTPDYPFVPFSATLLPPLSTAGQGPVHVGMALNLLMGSTARVSGLDLSVGVGSVSEDLRGAQLAAGAGLVGGKTRGVQAAAGFVSTGADLRGAQAAGGFSHIGGDLLGVQASGGFNEVGGRARGAQLAGGFNDAQDASLALQAAGGVNRLGDASQGVQLAGGVNVSGDGYDGVQAAGGVNWARDSFAGIQLAGGMNRALSLHGAQVAVLNVGGDITGAQIGVVNIATGTVRGLQLGVVNYADDVQGVPFGLVSIVRKGQLHPEVFATTHEPFNLGLRFGSRHFYTLLTTGLMKQDVTPDQTGEYYVGLGFGVHVPVKSAFIDLDASALERTFDETNEVLTRLRLSVGWQLFDHLALFGGVSANTYVGLDGEDDPRVDNSPFGFGPIKIDSKNAYVSGDTTVRVWPSIHLGVQL